MTAFWPRGLTPFKYLSAKAWLMRATCFSSAISCSLKRRPTRKGMLIVEKYSGPTTRTFATGRSISATCGWLRRWTPVAAPKPDGREVEKIMRARGEECIRAKHGERDADSSADHGEQ